MRAEALCIDRCVNLLSVQHHSRYCRGPRGGTHRPVLAHLCILLDCEGLLPAANSYRHAPGAAKVHDDGLVASRNLHGAQHSGQTYMCCVASALSSLLVQPHCAARLQPPLPC